MALRFSKTDDEVAGLACIEAVRLGCLSGGYDAVCDFHSVNVACEAGPGAVVTGSAMPDVVGGIEADDFDTIVAVHSALAGYLPRFAGPQRSVSSGLAMSRHASGGSASGRQPLAGDCLAPGVVLALAERRFDEIEMGHGGVARLGLPSA